MNREQRKALDQLHTILAKMENWQARYEHQFDSGCYVGNAKSELIRFLLPKLEQDNE